MSSDRRRSARVEILGKVHGHAVSLDVPVTVRDISLVGMAIETPFSFPVGAVHEFRLMLGDGAHVLLQGQARHCRLLTSPDVTATYLTGFQFVDEETTDGSSPVGDLMNRIS
jgi:hypothetical protein